MIWLLSVLSEYLCFWVVCGMVYYNPEWYDFIIALFLTGAIQHRLGILAHEGSHHLAFGKNSLNDFATRLFTLYPLNMNLSGYREFHWNHHRFVGTDKDPEKIHTKNPYLAQWNLPFRPALVILQCLLDLVGGGVPHLAMAGYLTRTEQKREYVAMFSLSLLTIGIFYWLGLVFVPILWYISLGTTFWLFFRLRMWTEHITRVEEDPTIRFAIPWWLFPIKWAILPYNTWMHWEHHKHPQKPFYLLPLVREFYQEPKILSLKELWNHHRKDNL